MKKFLNLLNEIIYIERIPKVIATILIGMLGVIAYVAVVTHDPTVTNRALLVVNFLMWIQILIMWSGI